MYYLRYSLYVALFFVLSGFLINPVTVYGQSQKSEKGKSDKKSKKDRLKKLDEIKVPGLRFSQKIPSNFPVPPYTNKVTRKSFVNTTKGSPSASVNIITSDSARTVFKWYQQVLKRDRWKFNIPNKEALGANSKMYVMDAVRGYNRVSISIYSMTKKSTSISINWSFRRK